MNVHDSEKMSGIMKISGYSETPDPGEADVLIFNTCCIREKAEQKFFSRLGRLKYLKKRNPGLKIAVSGCIAQQEGAGILKRAPYVDFVIGPQNIHLISEMGSVKGQQIACYDNPLIAVTDYHVDRKDAFRAWVTIMYGCDNYCSYCVVPYTRGREISRPSEKITEEIRELARHGFREITFLGQNVNSYHSDTDFPGLLEMANSIEGIERIRFVTSHPKDLSDKLVYAIRDLDKVCEHVHLPLQSGSSRILKLMNRKYSYDEYLQKVAILRDNVPGISITTDIIAGFPQESDEDHEATLRAIQTLEFDGMFAFKYSNRPETSAASLNGHLDEELKSQRLYAIIDMQDRITEKKNLALKGSCQSVLIESIIESREGQIYQGRTRTNKIVNCSLSSDSGWIHHAGEIVSVTIMTTARHSLSGMINDRPIV